MIFRLLPVGSSPPTDVPHVCYLVKDAWNDWYEFRTQYWVTVVESPGKGHDLGPIKIGQFEMPETGSPALPEEFESLEHIFFSVGQDENYYETLNLLAEATRIAVLRGLRDMAFDPALFQRARFEPVTTRSLLRSVDSSTVREKFRRLSRGEAVLTAFNFAYNFSGDNADGPNLAFEVVPNSHPPTNVHVLIGRNGVGKTRCIKRMLRCLVLGSSGPEIGLFRQGGSAFSRVVSVSFSAFDPFDFFPDTEEAPHRVPYLYIGLKVPPQGNNSPRHKNPPELAVEFYQSARACLIGARRPRWQRALEALQTDPLFLEARVDLLADEGAENLESRSIALFSDLSSGHGIVLLTMTRLVESVDEKTIVFLDEPEAHLHPPLLSAFVRGLSELLANRNGVAVVATHSPVVLQEVPRSCVTKLSRVGAVSRAERPEMETFGENVGTLTSEIFGLEVTQSGFHELLATAARQASNYDEALETFQHQLGSEARAILRAMMFVKQQQTQPTDPTVEDESE